MKHFNKMGKRGLALILSLTMITGMLNLTVFASETPEHTHNEDGWSCVQAEGTKDLVCTKTEHTHGSECYDEENALICKTEEHTHDSELCYTVTEGAWTCTPPAPGRVSARAGAVTDLAGLQAALANPGSTIQVSGTIVIEADAVLDLNGCTVQYTGDTGSVFHVKAGTLTLNDSVGTGTITGGKGTLIQKDLETKKWYLGGVEVVDGSENTPTYNGYAAIIDTRQGVTCGGAILLTNSGKLVMNGGAIDHNTAAMGGGICAFRSAVVEVYGGSVTNNTATTWGGGGMFLAAKDNVIDPAEEDISIKHNSTDTVKDLGGGGVFVDSWGSLKIINAVIHDNDADGLGGGVAGCLHGMVSNLSPDTAAIYSNSAKGTATLNNIVDHDGYTYKDGSGNKKSAKIFETWDAGLNGTSAADYFVAGFSTIGSRSLGGGAARWVGYAMARPETITNPKGTLVDWNLGATPDKNGEIKDEDPIIVQGLLGLHVTNPEEVAAAVDNNNGHKVYITNNHSGMHGGGVGTNGLLTFGEQSYSYSASKLTIQASKDVTSTRNGEVMSKAGYTFNLYDGDALLATAVSDAEGKITFENLSASALFGTGDRNGEVTATLTLAEAEGSTTGMKYDTAVRTIKLTANRVVSDPIIVTTHGGGNHVSVSTFTDTITKATVSVKVGEEVKTVEADVNNNVVTLKGEANFTNEMRYADLMVTKTVSYNATVSLKPDSTKFTIKVQLGDKTVSQTGTDYVGDGIYTLEVTAGPDQAGTARITDIPVGTTYTVTEEKVPENYQLSGITPGTGVVGVVAQDSIGASVSVENHYFKSTEIDIPVTKTWVNEDRTMPVPDSITVKLLQDGEEFRSADVKVNSDGDWTHTFTGLPEYKTETEKFEYTVGEVSVTYGGVKYTVDKDNIIEVKASEKNDDGLTALQGAFMSRVEDFVITNTWTMAGNEGEANLTVRKVAEDGKTALNGAVFTLTDGDGNVVAIETTDGATYNLGAPSALGTAMFTFGWDDVGEYTLTETAAPENYKVGAINRWKVIVTREIASVEKEESSASFINHWTVNVQVVDINTDEDAIDPAMSVRSYQMDEDTFLMEVANERCTGELTVGKAVNGADGERNREWNFTVTLTRSEAEPWIVVAGEYPVEYSSDRENGNVALAEADGVYTMNLTLKHGETATIKGLPVGLEYTVEEAEANTNSYTTTVTLNGQQVPVGGVKGVIPVGEDADTDAVEVVVFNNYREYYRPTRGSLQIIKTVTGGGDEAARRVFTFVVTGPNGYSETVTIIGAGTARLGNLAPGVYTVSESDAAISGFAWTVSGDGKADATVKAGEIATVKFENTYTDEPEESETPTPSSSEPVPEESDVPETPVSTEPDEEIDEPDTPMGDRPSEPAEPSEPANPSEPDEELGEPDVPLGPASPEPDEEIDEPDVPRGDVPQTGDSIALWLVVTLVSGAGLIGVALSGKRKEDKEA